MKTHFNELFITSIIILILNTNYNLLKKNLASKYHVRKKKQFHKFNKDMIEIIEVLFMLFVWQCLCYLILGVLYYVLYVVFYISSVS